METLDESGPTEIAGQPDARLAAALQAKLFPGLAQTAAHHGAIDASEVRRLGRYTVLRELGRGGMGIVFACYDEGLARKVAVKLLLTRSPDEVDHLRLEREARALARLSHPNVVQIHELGEHEGKLFLAMEFVEGQTLKSWLHDEPSRSWRGTAERLRQAGAGLMAAHAEGLVHRDFKPDNVMLGDDGRVRVLDFGLVRTNAALPELETTAERSANDGAQTTSDDALTRAGSMMGTPAYMAPEQLEAQSADEFSDQFSFCVTAFEALFGQRPFPGEDFASLCASVRAGVPVPIPEDSPVPRRLRAAILRGLARDPSARWPSMSALLDVFEQVLDASQRSRRRAWTVGALGIIAGMSAVGLSTVERGPEPCSFDSSALLGTWDEASKAELRRAFAQRPLPGLEASLRSVDQRLTRWGEAWLDGQRRSCEATHVLGTQSEAALDLRASCFERQRRETGALVRLLSAADGSGIVHAVELLERLPDTRVCEDPRLIETAHPLPTEPERREAILSTFAALERARALGHTTRLEQADASAASIQAAAARLDHLPLTVEAQALAGERELWRHHVDAGVPLLREAVAAAEVAGLDELSADLRVRLASHVVGQWGPTQLQTMVLEEAKTAVARIARPEDPRAMTLDFAQAALHAASGDYEAALAACRASIAQARALEDEGAVGRGQRQLGSLLTELARFDEAEQAYAEARAAFERAWGSGSLWSGASIELDLGMLELMRGRFEQAERHFAAAREVLTPLVDPGDSDLDLLELSEVKLALMRGELERAEQGARRVLDTSSSDLRRAEAWEALGVTRFYLGDMQGALEGYRRALPLLLAVRGPDNSGLGILHSNIGEALVALGDHAGAEAAFDEALDILARTLPSDHPDLAFPHKGRAQSRLALGHTQAALIDLERALALHTHNPGEPVERADVEFTLARALAETGARERAAQLANQAQRRLRELGHTEQAASIESWLHDQHLPLSPNTLNRTDQP